MFFDVFTQLCAEKQETANKVLVNCEISRTSSAKWKKGAIPNGATLAILAKYFEVPVDLLLGAPPFDYWEDINQNRKGFLHYTGISPDKLRVIWGIDANNPDACSIRDFAAFISMAVNSVRPTEEGDWKVELKDTYKQKATRSDGEERRQISDGDLMFALWGDATDITEEDLEDVKRFAAFVRERKKKE